MLNFVILTRTGFKMGVKATLTRIFKPLGLPLGLSVGLIVPILLLFGPMGAYGQNFSGAFEGMQDSDKPIKIEFDRLEVEDKKGSAIFTGNVEVEQGSTTLRARRMKATYAKNSGGPSGKIRFIEATGKIAVRSGNQKVTADRGDFNMVKQTVKLSGNVVITQGSNVVSGCILEVDLKTSSAILKPCKGQKRAVMVFDTKSGSQ